MKEATPWPYDQARRSPRALFTAASHPRPAWAARGRWLRRPNGERIEVHPIGALAEALGKSSFTVRRWEREGTLPQTPLVLPVAGGGPARRLYTTRQIAGVVVIAEQEGVANRKAADISATNFTARVWELYAVLFPEYFNGRAGGSATAVQYGS